jgi:hypothetical protein
MLDYENATSNKYLDHIVEAFVKYKELVDYEIVY